MFVAVFNKHKCNTHTHTHRQVQSLVPKAACSDDKTTEKSKEPVGIKGRLGAYWDFPSGSEIR